MKKIFFVNLCIVFSLFSQLFAQEWVVRYNGSGNLSDQANAIAIDDSQFIYVTGMSVGSGTYGDYVTIKYNQSGNEIWVARYDGGIYDAACAIDVDNVGNVYVTGTSCGSSYNNYDWGTVKYNSSGVEEWVARYNGPKDSLDEPTAIAVDRLGNVYVTGYCDHYYNTSSGDYMTVKYDNSGIKQWEARYDGSAHEGDRAEAIVVDDSGNVYVTGVSNELNTYADITTIKYDTNGNEMWVVQYQGTYSDHGKAIAIDSAGNVYVVGMTFNSGTRDDYITIKYNNDGGQQWVQYFGILDAATDEAHAIAVDNFGAVYVTGEGANYYGYDYATVKYDSLGIEQWVAWYDGGIYETDDAQAIAIDESANVYITGYSYSSNSGNDYATIKYNFSGVEQWVSRYNGPANSGDCAMAIALDSSDNVYVTGYSTGSGTNYDYATIKYLPTGPGVKENSLDYKTKNLVFEIYPNPFQDKVNIEYCKGYGAKCLEIRIYDLSGRAIRTFPFSLFASHSSVTWDGRDDVGKRVSPGLYFIRFKTSDYRKTKKVIMLR
jgi:hypothetical protein